jgi:hypothetical protein
MITALTSNLLFNYSNAAEIEVKKPGDTDYLTLLDSLKKYHQTSDLKKVSKVDSSFYTLDEKTMSLIQKTSSETTSTYSNSNDKQSNENLLLIKSLKDALAALKVKLDIQKTASKAFDEASKEATKLDKEEESLEDNCLNDFSAASKAGVAVNDNCNDAKDDDVKKECVDELNACTAKINSDLEKFNEYLTLREKLQESKTGFKEVNKLADALKAQLKESQKICSNYASTMAKAENEGSCLEKLEDDKVNESYQMSALKINKELDSYALIPKNRLQGWGKFKEMADVKIKETQDAMNSVQEHIKALSNLPNNESTASGDVNSDEISEGDRMIGIFGRNGVGDIPVGLIKKFFAGNPTPDQILKQAAELQLSKEDIARALEIVGYGGKTPMDLNSPSYNYFTAGPKALEKYGKEIDAFVAAKGGRFEDIEKSYRLTIPGVKPIDTNTVFSPKALISPEQMTTFFKTKPSNKEIFSKMYEYGLKQDDLHKILSSQNLKFIDGDFRKGDVRDAKGSRYFAKLIDDLFTGETGYGVSDPQDPNPRIVIGTGHKWDDVNKVWIPFGFKKK